MNDRFAGSALNLSPEALANVLGAVDIPSCPSVVSDVLIEAQRDAPDLRRLAAHVVKDPGMSATAIKLANSALFGGRYPVDSVHKALDRLGTRNVVSVIVASALRSSMRGASPALVERFWHRASSLAMASGLIARRVYGVSPDMAYLYGLFRDAAIPVLMRRFPDYGDQVRQGVEAGLSRVAAENATFSCSHPVIGYLLVQSWKLPDAIGQAIRFHHEPDVYDLGDAVLPDAALAMIAVAHVADHLISAIVGEADTELDASGFERAQVYLGIEGEDLADLADAVVPGLSASQ